MDTEPPLPTQVEAQHLDPSHPDDEARAGLAAGRPEALRRLVGRYESSLLELAARYVPASEAEDVVIETFTLLWKTADRLEPRGGSLWGYLARIARNRAIDRLRRARSRPTHSADVDLDRAQPGPGPADLAADAEQSEQLWSAVQELPPGQSQALLGAFADGRTHAQLAADLALPLGTVKTRIRLGLHALRQKLEPPQRP